MTRQPRRARPSRGEANSRPGGLGDDSSISRHAGWVPYFENQRIPQQTSTSSSSDSSDVDIYRDGRCVTCGRPNSLKKAVDAGRAQEPSSDQEYQSSHAKSKEEEPVLRSWREMEQTSEGAAPSPPPIEHGDQEPVSLWQELDRIALEADTEDESNRDGDTTDSEQSLPVFTRLFDELDREKDREEIADLKAEIQGLTAQLEPRRGDTPPNTLFTTIRTQVAEYLPGLQNWILIQPRRGKSHVWRRVWHLVSSVTQGLVPHTGSSSKRSQHGASTTSQVPLLLCAFLFCQVLFNLCVYITLDLERRLWAKANSETRVYLLEYLDRDTTTDLVPGVDFRLMWNHRVMLIVRSLLPQHLKGTTAVIAFCTRFLASVVCDMFLFICTNGSLWAWSQLRGWVTGPTQRHRLWLGLGRHLR